MEAGQQPSRVSTPYFRGNSKVRLVDQTLLMAKCAPFQKAADASRLVEDSKSVSPSLCCALQVCKAHSLGGHLPSLGSCRWRLRACGNRSLGNTSAASIKCLSGLPTTRFKREDGSVWLLACSHGGGFTKRGSILGIQLRLICPESVQDVGKQMHLTDGEVLARVSTSLMLLRQDVSADAARTAQPVLCESPSVRVGRPSASSSVKSARIKKDLHQELPSVQASGVTSEKSPSFCGSPKRDLPCFFELQFATSKSSGSEPEKIFRPR